MQRACHRSITCFGSFGVLYPCSSGCYNNPLELRVLQQPFRAQGATTIYEADKDSLLYLTDKDEKVLHKGHIGMGEDGASVICGGLTPESSSCVCACNREGTSHASLRVDCRLE